MPFSLPQKGGDFLLTSGTQKAYDVCEACAVEMVMHWVEQKRL